MGIRDKVGMKRRLRRNWPPNDFARVRPEFGNRCRERMKNNYSNRDMATDEEKRQEDTQSTV